MQYFQLFTSLGLMEYHVFIKENSNAVFLEIHIIISECGVTFHGFFLFSLDTLGLNKVLILESEHRLRHLAVFLYSVWPSNVFCLHIIKLFNKDLVLLLICDSSCCELSVS